MYCAVFHGLPLKPSVDNVVEKPEIAAKFGRGLSHYGDVFSDEIPDGVDERLDGTPGTDDACHPARRAAVRKRAKQSRLVDTKPVPERHGLAEEPDLRGEER